VDAVAEEIGGSGGGVTEAEGGGFSLLMMPIILLFTIRRARTHEASWRARGSIQLRKFT
jgi:hypothetical protein